VLAREVVLAVRYDPDVVDRNPGAEALGAILEQLRLNDGAGSTPPAVTQAQIDLLLARITAVTGWLRRTPDSSDASRAAVRLLLADVAMVAAQFRGNTTALDDRLTRAVEHARLALESTTDGPAPAD
jgi:hypothetical protein